MLWSAASGGGAVQSWLRFTSYNSPVRDTRDASRQRFAARSTEFPRELFRSVLLAPQNRCIAYSTDNRRVFVK